MVEKADDLTLRDSGMWKKAIRFVCRYFSIGFLIGIGIYAIDEIHWRLVGSERIAELQQSIDSLNELKEKLVFEPLINHLDNSESEAPPSNETASEADLLRPTPYFVNGEIQGYRVYPGSNRSGFRSLGLRPGDLVTEIDGQPLNETAVASELFEKALSGQTARLSVHRGDERKIIVVKVD